MKHLIPTLLLILPTSLFAGELEDQLIERLKVLEGYVATPYKPLEAEEYYTIGYGHYGPDVTLDMELTEEEAHQLLLADIMERLSEIKLRIHDFDKFSVSLQVELMQSWFRGGLPGSPITISLINEYKFDEAAAEFLRNREYQTTPLNGVKTRMEAVSQALLEEPDKCSACH